MTRSALVTGVLAVAGLGAVVAGVMQLAGGGAVAIEAVTSAAGTPPPSPTVTPFLTMGEKALLAMTEPPATDSSDARVAVATPTPAATLRPIQTARPISEVAPPPAPVVAPVITVPSVQVISESRTAPADRAPSTGTRRK